MKRSISFITITICLLAVLSVSLLSNRTVVNTADYLSANTLKTHRILLIPLDSRPQCLDFVIDLAKIADFDIIVPPRELLGDDREFARPYKLRQWLSEHIKDADAAILSADMLIHGGLLPSRLNAGSKSDIEETWQLLQEIRRGQPELPLYVFNIIPRITVAEQPEVEEYKDALLEYSALTEKIYTFGQADDIKQRHYLEQKLPASLIFNYHKLYNDNAALNAQLLKLTADGVITKLIIGQDDGEVFGLPNIVKEQFHRQASALKLSPNRAALTRGADEVAQTLLCSIYQYFHGFNAPKIFVMYNNPHSAEKIMPYMPNPVKETIREKIYLSGALPVQTAAAADFILYVNIGSDKTIDNRFNNAKDVKQLLISAKPVALIDLSEDFRACDTLLPVLINNNAPLNRLIAYAGWNTTSNAAGTALAQAILFTERQSNDSSAASQLRLYQNNLAFLNARFLEDYFYLKHDIDKLNSILEEHSIDRYNINNDIPFANSQLQELFTASVKKLISSRGWQETVKLKTTDGPLTIKPAALDVTVQLPWHRTFEIDVELKMFLSVQQENFSE